MTRITLACLFMVLIPSLSQAQLYGEYRSGNKPLDTEEVISRAAGCAPATSSRFIELNNVRAMIHTAGNVWQVPGVGGFGASVYEVPKGSGIMALFAGSLWLGGVDINGQLKLAALRYRQGNDYWTGPLTTDGDAEVDADVCQQYDQHFVITRQEVEVFNGWWEAGEFDNQFGTNTQNEFYPGYEIPESILLWPAHGDVSLGQDFYLAPFYDRDADGVYDPANGGDYPWYDINGEVDCQSPTNRRVTLFGDQTFWWVFNDKGNIHTETGADPIGMEIKAQAFAFATNDEINNMTFFNYELINRGTQTLFETYFGQFIDAALGGPFDDYVGCDVSRGLGYVYNGRQFDADDTGYKGYGSNPPAVGVDFFEGPYQDNDGVDNAVGIGPGEAVEGNGLGYGDGIVDNERFGMRRFLYYNNTGGGGNPNQTDPTIGTDYYNYLRGFWKDGTKFVYGGNGHISDPAADPNVSCDFMFPGDSDPLAWGTGGVVQPSWTEQTAGNVPFDRRFAQSAGPFVLQPGAVNNITVGVVYARATSGDPFASVEALRVADDKAQSLFENCFRVLSGPDAPEIAIQELENELILTLYNLPNSNNANEDYVEQDPFIPEGETVSVVSFELDTATGNFVPDTTVTTSTFDRFYRFQGYQIFQTVDATVGPQDLANADLARLVAQVDIEDGVSQIINYEYNEELEASIPVEKVNGADEGIRHSFQITEDLFAQGERTLINHKTYCYMAIAYSHNDFKHYDPDEPSTFNGQKLPYKASRKSATGSVRVFCGIPHSPSPEAGGTMAQASYGDGFEVTRIEGQGNGGFVLDFTAASEAAIVSNWGMAEPTYKAGSTPIGVKVIDPLNIPSGLFRVRFLEDSMGGLDSATWQLEVMSDITLLNGSVVSSGTIHESDQTIAMGNEQLFPDYGFSITIGQHQYQVSGADRFTEFIEADISFADSSKQWLTGIPDVDGFSPLNWIRSGTSEESNPPNDVYNDYLGIDDDQTYEGVLGGWWAPWRLVADEPGGPIGPTFANTIAMPDIADVQSIDIVITNDRSKWSRVPVIEMQEDAVLAEGGAAKSDLRESPSRDKSGLRSGEPGYNSAEGDLNGTTGMSWFPGYAVNLETGERLNMAFGEDSWNAGENGRDMMWNPSDRLFSDIITGDVSYLMGGRHYIYVFNNDERLTGDNTRMPSYDEGAYLNTRLQGSNGDKIKVWRSTMWVGLPLLEEGEEFMSNDARIRIRVKKPYEEYDTQAGAAQNDWFPLYEFGTDSRATNISQPTVADSALSLINVVPNPYYGYNNYEVDRLDTRIKVVNLPETCTISIYNLSGTLVRRLSKDNVQTFVDWDLKNQVGIPISGGVYIIHVDVPGVGERVLKWFGALRPADVSSF